MKAVFSPGPSYSDPNVRKFAGWWHILELYGTALEELGFDVFIPEVPRELIEKTTPVGKMLSYDIVAAQQIPGDAELFLGPPGYSLVQMMAGQDNNWGRGMRTFLCPWNNADWWRDEQLAEEYKQLGVPYDLSPAWRWINRTALEMCDHVIACSPWVKWTYSKVVPEEKISITSWGVDSKKFYPPDVEPPGFNVLFVGSDPVRKGLRYLVEAMEDLEGAELWIAGCPTGRDPHGPIKVRQFGTIKVRQFGMLPHSEIVKVYQQCHVICLPTLEDGIALAIQEGMACGLVPVTSPETAEAFVDGDSGFKVDYRDMENLYSSLRLLQTNSTVRKEMSQRARELAVSQTWEKTKEEFKGVIKREMKL